MTLIKFMRARPDLCFTPARKHPHDAGFDLGISRPVVVDPGAKAQLPTNLILAIPSGWFGLVVPRSSIFYKLGLIVHHGVVDSGFRGEVMILVVNPTRKRVVLYEGERVAQLLILPSPTFNFEEHNVLPEGERGDKGFGSTGR